jgi:hypothetical protein
MVIYRWLADAVVVLHATYVAAVIGGLLVVPLGALFRWRWVRNFWFRAIHFVMITIVVVESLLDVDCPYTTSEAINRLAAGERVSQGTFIGRWAHELLFYEAKPWVFTVAYCAFGALVVLGLVLVPPKWPWHPRGSPKRGS